MSEVVAYVFHSFAIVTVGVNVFQHLKLTPATTTSSEFRTTGLVFVFWALYSSIVEIIFNALDFSNATWFLVYLGYVIRSSAFLWHVFAGINILEGSALPLPAKDKETKKKEGDEEAAEQDKPEGDEPEETQDVGEPSTLPEGDTTIDSQTKKRRRLTAHREGHEIRVTLPERSVRMLQWFFTSIEILVAAIGIIIFWVVPIGFREIIQTFGIILLIHAVALVVRMMINTSYVHVSQGFATLTRGKSDEQLEAAAKTGVKGISLKSIAEAIDKHSRGARLSVPVILLGLVIATEGARVAGSFDVLGQQIDGFMDAWYEISQWLLVLGAVVLAFSVKRPDPDS